MDKFLVFSTNCFQNAVFSEKRLHAADKAN